MFRIEPGSGHGRLPVEAKPFLNTQILQFRRARSEVEEEHQIQGNRRCQNGIPAQEIDLDLHRIPKPAEDVDIVPTLFIITTWRIIVNPYLVINILVKIGIKV